MEIFTRLTTIGDISQACVTLRIGIEIGLKFDRSKKSSQNLRLASFVPIGQISIQSQS